MCALQPMAYLGSLRGLFPFQPARYAVQSPQHEVLIALQQAEQKVV